MVSIRTYAILKNIEIMARRRNIPIIGPDRGRILVNVIRKTKPKRILEVGTLIGYSTILMAKELGKDMEIITIEIDEDAAKIANENIHNAGIKPRIRVIAGNALKVIPKLDGEFDMVFLDANKYEYLNYLKLVEDKLPKGAVVVADNVGTSAYSMRDYLDYVRNSGKYRNQFISVGWDGMEVSRKL